MILRRLDRVAYLPFGTWGVLTLGDGRRLWTMERPWLGNAREISCIPDGSYRCVPSTFYRGGYPAALINGVPGRSDIKIHAANVVQEVKGCIAVGMALRSIRGELTLVESRAALAALLADVGPGNWELEIGPTAGTSAVVWP